MCVRAYGGRREECAYKSLQTHTRAQGVRIIRGGVLRHFIFIPCEYYIIIYYYTAVNGRLYLLYYIRTIYTHAWCVCVCVDDRYCTSPRCVLVFDSWARTIITIITIIIIIVKSPLCLSLSRDPPP